MDTSTADGVRLVPADEIPACLQVVVEYAQDFVLLAGVPLHGSPRLDVALRRVARRGGTVRIVVNPEQARAGTREIVGLVAEGADVLVSESPLPGVAATEDAAIEMTSECEDLPRAAVLVTRSGAGVRWARIVARAKVAQLGTRPAARRRERWMPAHPETWRSAFRALFRS